MNEDEYKHFIIKQTDIIANQVRKIEILESECDRYRQAAGALANACELLKEHGGEYWIEGGVAMNKATEAIDQALAEYRAIKGG